MKKYYCCFIFLILFCIRLTGVASAEQLQSDEVPLFTINNATYYSFIPPSNELCAVTAMVYASNKSFTESATIYCAMYVLGELTEIHSCKLSPNGTSNIGVLFDFDYKNTFKTKYNNSLKINSVYLGKAKMFIWNDSQFMNPLSNAVTALNESYIN